MERVIPTVPAECVDIKHNPLVVHLGFLLWKSQTDISARTPTDILSRNLRVFPHSRQTDARVGPIIMSFSADEPRIRFAFLYVNLLSLLVTQCTTSLTFNNCTLCPHCIYVFCIYLRKKQRLVPLTA
jgi:hypothetical protein